MSKFDDERKVSWLTCSQRTELTTANLTYLTLRNAIADLTSFANSVDIPFHVHHRTNAAKAPWVLVGGSYPGALTAWTAAKSPGTFGAYMASSAVVKTMSDFWQYFLPQQIHIPRNCSKDVQLVVQHMDDVFTTGTQKQRQNLKARFGLERVTHADDVMYAVGLAGPGSWQASQLASDELYMQFCDHVEDAVHVKDPAKLPGAGGVGLEKAIDGYAKFFKKIGPVLAENFCGSSGKSSLACFNSHDPDAPRYTDTSLDNPGNPQWTWLLCKEPFEWWQTAAED